MQKFLDVNVWLPMLWQNHQASQKVKNWLKNTHDSLIMCRVVQMALLRHLTNPAIMGSQALTNRSALKLIQALLQNEKIHLKEEPNEVSRLFPKMGESSKANRNQWTDAYLAAFAIGSGYELVTFDRDFKKFQKDGLRLQLLKYES